MGKRKASGYLLQGRGETGTGLMQGDGRGADWRVGGPLSVNIDVLEIWHGVLSALSRAGRWVGRGGRVERAEQ